MSNWNSTRDERRDFDRAAFWTTGRVILFIVIGVIVAGILSAVIWAVTVGTSQARGIGDGIIQKNSAQNWVDAQARFEENYADIEATQFKIEQAQTELDAAREQGLPTTTLEQTLTGTMNYCASLVADYNADARNYLREDFRASDLPDKIDVDRTCSGATRP